MEMKFIQGDTKVGSYGERLTLDMDIINCPYFIRSPFANCQTCTVGFAQNLKRFSEEELKKILSTVIQKFGKLQFMMDIKTMFVEELKTKLEPFIDCILVETPYTNNNSSEMTILLVKFKMKF